MNIKAFSLSKIALGNLRNRKRQYVMLAIGILLAIYFIATALLFGFGIYTSLKERELNRYGQQDAILFDCGDAPINDLLSDGTFSTVGKAEVLGDAITGEYDTRLFSIAKYDDTAKEISRRRLKEGEYPSKAGEIALELSALAQLRQDAGVGDTVNLTLCIPDGNGGFLNDTTEKTYTLTGILYDQRIYWDYYSGMDTAYNDIPAGLVSNVESSEPGGRAVTMAYCVYTYDNEASQKALDDFCATYSVNIMSGSIFVSDEAWYEIIFTGSFAVIIGLILVVACCLGIVNAFSASLDARRRQIGLLRAVGATQKQIRNIFGRETLMLSALAIPLGLALAVLSIFAIFSWLGEEYVLVLSVWVLPCVAAVGILCVALASYIPLRRAAKVSPMQAIRDVDLMRRVRKGTIRSREAFDAPRLIASRSGRIYRMKRAGISIAMAAGLLVFTMTSMIMMSAVRQISEHTYRYDYNIYYDQFSLWDIVNYEFHKPGLTEQDRQELMALPLVESITGEKEVRVKLLPEKITSYATGDGWQWDFSYLSPNDPSGHMVFGDNGYNTYLKARDLYYNGADYLTVSMIAVEENLIGQLSSSVYEGSINIDRIRKGEEVLLVAPEKYEIYYKEENGGAGSYENWGEECTGGVTREEGYELVTSQNNDMFHAGDRIAVSLLYTDGKEQYGEEGLVLPKDTVRIDKTVTIGALLDIHDYEQLDIGGYPGFLSTVTTLSGLSAIGFDVPYNSLDLRLSETPDAQTEQYISDSIEKITARVPDIGFSSSLERAREDRRLAVQTSILGAALAVLLFAITASMMNNTLSAHIRAGRRSIGTLRAVGMDSRDIFRSYFYQMVPLLAWGVSAGLVLSAAIVFYFIKTGAFGNTAPYVPVWEPLIFAALLLGVCAWNIRTRLRGILRESITENIREL